MGTPDGGAYTTVEDMNLFLAAIQKKILLDDTHAKLLLTAHCPYTREKEWWGIPGLYERNGYAFEFLFLPDKKEPFCIYKDGHLRLASNLLAHVFRLFHGNPFFLIAVRQYLFFKKIDFSPHIGSSVVV